jgi:hypothetical protein
VIIIFVGIELANLMPTGGTETERECTLGIVQLCDSDKFSIPPERQDLAINVTNLRCQDPSAFYGEIRLKEGITARTLSQSTRTFPRNWIQLCAVLATSFFLQQELGVKLQ